MEIDTRLGTGWHACFSIARVAREKIRRGNKKAHRRCYTESHAPACATPDLDAVAITVKSEGKGPPTEVRVRKCLKELLRRHRLRCVDVKAVRVEEI